MKRCVMVIILLAFSVLAAHIAMAATADIRLPSDSTQGGALAVRVHYPDSPASFRYGQADGAPVLVLVPGGFDPGRLRCPNVGDYKGFIVVTFLFPGGREGAFRSDGTYDQRGDSSQRALRDVLRFACGAKRDSAGRLLDDIAGGRARRDAVGMLALSNGGSIAVTTLGRLGSQIPSLAFLVSWESPTNDQILAVELGTHSQDPDPEVDASGDGIVDNDAVNGAYLRYGYPQLTVDYSRLRYDPEAKVTLGYGTKRPSVYKGMFFFDNNRDGAVNLAVPGTMNTDTNGNGMLDPDEDYALSGLVGWGAPGEPSRGILSVAAVDRAESAGLAPAWPQHYYSPSETRAYWAIRDAAAWFARAMAAQKKLAGVSVFAVRDHVQNATDHPHVRHDSDGFRSAKHWFRLNPDRAYVEAAAGASMPSAADNNANLNIAKADLNKLAEPDKISRYAQAAACAEMADRSVYGVWDVNLKSVLTGEAQAPLESPAAQRSLPASGVRPASERTGSKTHWITFAVNCHDWVNPKLSAEAVAFVMDTLEAHGARGEFYLTAPLVEAWLQSAPEIVSRLRDGRHTVSYHTRAPHPACFAPTSKLLTTTPLADYERYHLDLTTGGLDRSRPGGLALVDSTFGRTPATTGVGVVTETFKDEYSAMMAARGVPIGVFHHGPIDIAGAEDVKRTRFGLVARPNDYFVARVDGAGHPSDKGQFWWNRAADRSLSAAALADALRTGFLDTAPRPDGAPHFAVCVIHEDNFYASGTPWGPIYFNSPDNRDPKDPPYDLSATAPWVTYRSEEQRRRIRDAFRAMAAAAAADRDTGIVTGEDVTAYAASCYSPASDPKEDVQWTREPGFERDPPADYRWSATGGTIAVIPAAAHRGSYGMRVTAQGGRSCRAAQRVDVDKGREYSFGAALRSTSAATRVSLTLTPVAWERGKLAAAGPVFRTSSMTGSFGWSTASGSAYLDTNYDYVLLQVDLAGGSVDVDDVFMTSAESGTVPIPPDVYDPVLCTVLIHSENVAALTRDTDYFRAKTRLLEDLAAMLSRHGARLVIQPELELATGTQKVDGYHDFFRRLHQKYGCELSVHTHGPRPEAPLQEHLDYIALRKRTFESLGAGEVTDLNGNFTLTDWSVFSQVGIRSMTAFKNVETQACYQGRYFHPWRPSPGNPYTDEAAWSVDNPASKVVYIPGSCTRVTKYREYLLRRMLPGLTQALWNSDPVRPATWYMILHVDSFGPRDGSSIKAYMGSDAYQEDLGAVEDLFRDVFDPLLQRNLIEWSTPSEMRAAFESR